MAALTVGAGPVCARTADGVRPLIPHRTAGYNGFSRALAARPVVAQRHNSSRYARAVAVTAAAPAAAPAQQRIRIKLKSYWVDLLQDSVDKILEAASSTGATIAGPVPLPTRYVIMGHMHTTLFPQAVLHYNYRAHFCLRLYLTILSPFPFPGDAYTQF